MALLAGLDVLQARLARLSIADVNEAREEEKQRHMLTDLLKACGVSFTVQAAGPTATKLSEHSLELQLARTILLAKGRRVNLTEMMVGDEQRDQAVLAACKRLVSSGLGSLSRHGQGSVLVLDFAGLSPIAFTIEKKNALRDALATLLSADSQHQHGALPVYACLYEVMQCSCIHVAPALCVS